MTTRSRRAGRIARLGLLCAVAVTAPGRGLAQTPPTTGALTLSGGLDAPSVYIFRGVVQEVDPRVTLAPYVDVGVRLREDGRVRLNVGLWNSLHTGTSGSGGPLKGQHYAERFASGVTFALPEGLSVSAGYLANSSPNRGFDTIKEVNVSVARPGPLAPYVMLAFEVSDGGQLDEGAKKGRYLEIGASPALDVPRAGLTVTLPVKAGVSLGDYYELFGSDFRYHDHRFGFASAGAHLAFPLTTSGSRFGAWRLTGGADVFTFGDATRAFNQGKRSRVVGTAGAAFTY